MAKHEIFRGKTVCGKDLTEPMSKSLRVAVVGAGPAGMYAIEHLLNESSLDTKIDLYERLPTPWGLVRYGVAPDHPEKKRVIDRTFKFYLAHPAVRFIGNVEVGKDISHSELSSWYHAVIYAVGAAEDKRLGIPGESLSGSFAARELVAWYNGHPDYSHLQFDLSGERAIVVGNGNVALDVARILTTPTEVLEKTDIADYALEALRQSRIREVVILGRSGCQQAAFHGTELDELGYCSGVDIVVDQDELPKAQQLASVGEDWKVVRKVLLLARLASRVTKRKNKRIVFRFLVSPVELVGSNSVEQVVVAKNQLVPDECGRPILISRGETHQLDTGICFRAIGYRSVPLPGLPFDEHRGVVENVEGRVSDRGRIVPGTFVTGWVKSGPRGIIGTNKQCARETIFRLLEDARAGALLHPAVGGDRILEEVRRRKADVIEFANWLNIDRAEVAAGTKLGRSRLKLTSLDAMLTAAGVYSS